MKTVFIGGSRRISRLGSEIRGRLDQIIENNLCVLLGDANGADKAVQSYLKERSYPHVIIFCTAGQCRNNVGRWRVESVNPPHKTRDFEFFSAKDAAMAREADVGLMIWDGESSGTMVNAARLVGSGKSVVVYVAPQKAFWTVKSPAQLEKLLLGCPVDTRQRIDRYISEHAQEYTQPALL
jgi:adenine-specific DNA-methyltransferase